MSNKRLIIQRFRFPIILTCQGFRSVGGIRRVQISRDICTRFARYLYSTKQSWIITFSYLSAVLQTRAELFAFELV